MTYTTRAPTGYPSSIQIHQPTPWFNLAMVALTVPSLIVLTIPATHQTTSTTVRTVIGLTTELDATAQCLADSGWVGKLSCLTSASKSLESLGYNGEQQSVIARVIATGDEMGMSDEDIAIAIATCLVETQCKELAESVSDRDSRGPFQQRPSQGWADSNDTVVQAKAFFERLQSASGSTPGARAQDIQRSAYPARYDKRMAEARQALSVVRGTGKGKRIAQTAKAWVGKDFRPGQLAQCAYFVRDVLDAAGIEVGVTSKPMDRVMEPMTKGMANSLSGKDIGKVIKRKGKLKPGDIVFFSGTYRPAWVVPGEETNMITHVGIYIGDGMMVDRPTAAKPVQQRSIDTFTFYGAVRINAK